MLTNFVRTIWNPSRSDVRAGVDMLVKRAVRRGGTVAPAIQALFDERYDPPLDLDELERLPDGTLGREYARFMRANGIEPLGAYVPAHDGAVAYMVHRAYKLHDVMHVVLDCDASVLGEVRIVSFSLGQAGEHGYAARLALGVLLAHLALRSPSQLPEAVRLSRAWRELGESVTPYAMHRLEAMMELPVEAVRARVLASGDDLSSLATTA